MIDPQILLPILQLILAFCNIVIIGYGLYKFLNKPHDTLEARIIALEIEHKEMKRSLLQGNDRFREQDGTNEVLIRSTLALIEFEMQYCMIEHKDMSEDLKQAKKELREYLSKR